MTDAYDVVVIGGGVMGCATLHYLAKMGVTNTLLLERDTLASGSTGRSMTILRMHYSNAITTHMAKESRDVIADFEAETGHPSGFVNTGYLFLVESGQEEALRTNVALQRSHGVDSQPFTPQQAASNWPEIDFDGVAAVAYEPDSGYADSSAVTNGFALSAREHGAEVRLGTTVTGIAIERGRAVGVETTEGRIDAGAVVLTAGPWIPEFLHSVGAPLPLSWVRHQVIKLHRPLDKIPSHMIIADTSNGISFRPDAGDLTLIGIREDPTDRDTYNQSVDPSCAAESLEYLAKRYPAFDDAGWDGGWSGLFTVTPDHHPVIDRVPGVDNLVVGAGFSGHGFKLSPTIGRALAELAVHGRSTSIDMSPLRFTRFAEDDLLQSAYGECVFA
ncbi:MAG: FAD-binding oxidoreductase [Chloroflexi bacterium]|nr:FAD-binding oxidoreductase [Chloroflexota bacterium]